MSRDKKNTTGSGGGHQSVHGKRRESSVWGVEKRFVLYMEYLEFGARGTLWYFIQVTQSVASISTG